MAKKKNRTEASEAGPLPPADPLAPDEEFVGPPVPEPSLAPSPDPPPRAELIRLEPPRADRSPVAPPVAEPAPDMLGPLQERLSKLEEALAGLQQLQGLEQRVVEQVTTQLRDKPAAPAPAAPSVLSRAATLLEAGKHLLPTLPAGQPSPRSRGWLLWEMIAELRAMVCMYTDPRYHMSRWGYLLPPALFLAFLLARFWLHIVPFYGLLEKAYLGWLIALPVELSLLYAMFKILGHEARRYRETAPDLPPSLRL